MFKVGDRVRVIGRYYDATVEDEGIIKALPGNNGSLFYPDCYSVEFPNWGKGHDCNGTVPSGHGNWIAPECLELIKSAYPEKIVITHNGKTTLARLYENNKVVKSAEAKCDPRDDFDFAVGAKLAFERLTEEKKEPPFKVGDVVKVKAAGYHRFIDGTIGQIVVIELGEASVRGYIPGCDRLSTQIVKLEDCEKVTK